MLLEEYTEMFRNLDQNNNGYLSAAEIKQDWQEKGVNLTAQGVRDVIDGFDLDEDRHISLEEYLNVLTLKHLVVSRICYFDNLKLKYSWLLTTKDTDSD